MTRVAFLGLGAMGGPMAARLLAAGHEVSVWNRTPGRDDDLVGAGANRASTPAEAVGGVEVAITMLADPAALEAVLFGPDGVAGSIPTDATLVDCSTVGPEPIREAAERLQPVAVLDAPVLGSVPHAEAGELTLLVGGDPAVLDAHAELLGILGTTIHVGGQGAGATLKLANNAAVMGALVGLAEVLAYTDRTGIDQQVALDALSQGPLSSLVGRWSPKIVGDVERVDFRLALARKDLGLAIDEATSAGVALTVSSAAATRCDQAIEAGHGDDDNSSVVAVVRAEPDLPSIEESKSRRS